MSRSVAIAVALASALLLGLAQEDSRDRNDKKVMPKSFVGKAPPKIAVDLKNWINVEKKAPTAEQFKGRVVFMEFGFLG